MHQIVLEHLSGSKSGEREVYLPDKIGDLTVGRDDSCQLMFDPRKDDEVSRRHARIAAVGEGFRIEDLGSSNATFVNGSRISGSTLLQSGDEIQFGAGGPKVRFILERASEATLADDWRRVHQLFANLMADRLDLLRKRILSRETPER